MGQNGIKRKQVLPIIFYSLSIIFFIAGAVWFISFGNGRDKSNASIPVSSEPAESLTVSETESKPDPVTSVSDSNSEKPEPEPTTEAVKVPNPYKDYYLQNPDMVGWLKIDDTIVDYPVMWTVRDEDYYLLRDFNGKYSGNGCLILDTDSCMDPLTTNLIIHGHNNPHAMFGELDKYKDKEYRDAHPYISLYGKDKERRYEVMAVFKSKVFYVDEICFKYYKFFEADTEEEFNDFYDNVMAMSMYDSGVTASFGDRFLTLSTCSYHVENGRFVVVAKEIESGDEFEPFE